MPRAKRSYKKAEITSPECKWYVMYGYSLDDDSKTAFFGKNSELADDIVDAKKFPSANVLSAKGFGTPQQWLEMVNSDPSLNQGYKFHLVHTTISS